ncbi:MAG TPA: DHHA1 domain-containing protein, partial [Polyangiaceae bacterium]|nr:DHHA1 domain-containing protein [Polyangiaceae bacterium]
LCDLIGLNRSRPLVASDVSFRLAPRLNAPGRLGAPDQALELMLEKDQARAQGLAAAVEQSCQLRRETQKSIEAEAEEDAERHAGEHSIVVGRRGWNHGIVGIVAGRLADRRGLPVVVVGFGDQGGGHGSVRGPAGFPLFDAVEAASEALVRFGGHQAAAGLELPFERLQEFREAFDRACGCRSPSEAAAAPEPLAVESSDDLWAVYEDLRELEPCGQTNPRPRLQLSGRVRASRALRGNHLKLELEPAPGQRLAVFAPGFGELAVSIGQRVTVVGDLRVDAYRGGEALEFLAEQVSVEPVTSEPPAVEPTTAAPPTSEPSTVEPPKR